MLKQWDDLDLYARLMEARKDARVVGAARRAAVCQRPRASRHRAQQNSEGLRGALALDAGISHAVRARMGLPRDADRAQGLARSRRRQGAHDSEARAAQAVPRRSGEVGRFAARGFSPPRMYRRLVQSVPHDGAGVRRRGNRRAAQDGRERLRVSRPAPGALVLRLPHGAGGGRSRVSAIIMSPSIYVAFALNSNLNDAGALAAEAKDRAELAAAHQAGKLFAGHLDDDAVDAARESRNLAERDVRLRRAESWRELLRGGGAAGRRGREGMRAHSRESESRSIARRSRRSTARIFFGIRFSRAT